MSHIPPHCLTNREDTCLQTLLLLFKFANHRNKRPFVSTANEALVGTFNNDNRRRQQYYDIFSI